MSITSGIYHWSLIWIGFLLKILTYSSLSWALFLKTPAGKCCNSLCITSLPKHTTSAHIYSKDSFKALFLGLAQLKSSSFKIAWTLKQCENLTKRPKQLSPAVHALIFGKAYCWKDVCIEHFSLLRLWWGLRQLFLEWACFRLFNHCNPAQAPKFPFWPLGFTHERQQYYS